MLTKRIIACLDVKDGKVVKGVKFKEHKVMGDILPLARRYQEAGVDELVFYDISASPENRSTSRKWVEDVSKILDIPFCVAGGIRTIEDAKRILENGADKVSINTPAIENPEFITELSEVFGSQCVVVGIDSQKMDGEYVVYSHTGLETSIRKTRKKTFEWAQEVEKRGAGEIVLNCMNQDGVGRGYDLAQLQSVSKNITIPLIASGGAGSMEHFLEVFTKTNVDGALAAGIFHREEVSIVDLKAYLHKNDLCIRV